MTIIKEEDIIRTTADKLKKFDTVHRVVPFNSDRIKEKYWLQRGMVTKVTDKYITVSFCEMWGRFDANTGISERGLVGHWLAEIGGIEKPQQACTVAVSTRTGKELTNDRSLSYLP